MADLPAPLDPDSSDEQLWRAVTAADPLAFGLFFRRRVAGVNRFCFRRTGSTQLAEDLTSAVFMHAWRSRSGVDLDTVRCGRGFSGSPTTSPLTAPDWSVDIRTS